MSTQNFIPTLWSARLLANLDKAHVYGAVVNRDYEGEIKKMGDSVKINKFGDITIGDYTQANINPAQDLTSSQVILTIDQAKYFNFQVDSVDAAQANVNLMDSAMVRAGYNMADVVDKYIASIASVGATGGAIGDDTTPKVLTASTAYDNIVDLSVLLDESNTPSQGRYIVVPSFLHGLLLKDSRFIRANDMGNTVLTTGFIGQVAGFNVYTSNNVPNVAGAKYKVVAGHTSAISFAEQVVDTMAYQPEARFADAVKGLVLFGAKVVQPNALAVLTVNK